MASQMEDGSYALSQEEYSDYLNLKTKRDKQRAKDKEYYALEKERQARIKAHLASTGFEG